MNKLRLDELVLEALEQELHKDNRFLTASDIACECTVMFHKNGIRKNVQPVSIKNCMPKVRQKALDLGLVITSIRRKHIKVKKKKNNNKQSRSIEVYGWKIADLNDKKYIIADMDIRKLISNGNSTGLRKLAETAKKKGLIAPEDITAILELSE